MATQPNTQGKAGTLPQDAQEDEDILEDVEDPTGADKQAHSGDPSTKPTDKKPGDTPVNLTQRQLERLLDNKLAKSRKEWELETERANQERETERQRQAQEQAGEYKVLYEQEKASTAALKATIQAMETELSTLRGDVEKQIEAAIKDWPDEVLEMDPKTVNPTAYTLADRQAWYSRAIKLAQRLMGTAPNPGNPGGPAPARNQGNPANVDAYVAKRRQDGFDA